MKSLLVVQHCQSEHHVNGMTGGWTDTPLTDLGRRQAGALAARLARELAATPCRVYASDLQRAAQTAEIIGRALGLPTKLSPELREFNNGIAAGMKREEARKIEIGRGIPNIDRQPYPQAETWRRFYGRIAGFMDRLAAEDQDGETVLVTHGGVVINLIAWWLRLDVPMLARVSFGVAPGGVTRLTTNQWGERTLKVLSDTSHLVDLTPEG